MVDALASTDWAGPQVKLCSGVGMNIQRLVLLDDTPAARPVRLPDKDAVRYEVFKEPHNAVDDCTHLRIRRIIRSVVVEVSVGDGPNVDREFIAIVNGYDSVSAPTMYYAQPLGMRTRLLYLVSLKKQKEK